MRYTTILLVWAATLLCSRLSGVRAIDVDHQLLQDIYDLHQLEGTLLLQVGPDSGCATASRALVAKDETEQQQLLNSTIVKHRNELEQQVNSLLFAILNQTSHEYELWPKQKQPENNICTSDTIERDFLKKHVIWPFCSIEGVEANSISQICSDLSVGCGNLAQCTIDTESYLQVYRAALNLAVAANENEAHQSCVNTTGCVSYTASMRGQVELLASTLLDLLCLVHVSDELELTHTPAGRQNSTEGSQNLTEGSQNLTKGSQNLTEGSQNSTKGSQNLTEGSQNSTKGTQNSKIATMVDRFAQIWTEASEMEKKTNWDDFHTAIAWRKSFESRLLSLSCFQFLPLLNHLSQVLSKINNEN